MREIKFRCYDGYKIHYGISIDSKGRPISELWNTENHIVMQFTGLLGHNSQEVYEGDICNFAGTIGVFKWDDIQWKVFNKEGKWMPLITLCTPEIIGNIYENPELLK